MQKYLKNVANKIAFWDMCWDPIHLWYVQNTMIGITQKGGKCPGIFTIKLHFQMLSVDPDIWYPGKYLLKSISPDYRVRMWEKVPWRAILNICLCCELSQKENIKTYCVLFWDNRAQFKLLAKKLLHFHYCTFPPNSIAIMQ